METCRKWTKLFQNQKGSSLVVFPFYIVLSCLNICREVVRELHNPPPLSLFPYYNPTLQLSNVLFAQKRNANIEIVPRPNAANGPHFQRFWEVDCSMLIAFSILAQSPNIQHWPYADNQIVFTHYEYRIDIWRYHPRLTSISLSLSLYSSNKYVFRENRASIVRERERVKALSVCV